MHGGARVVAERKRKAVTEKYETGNPGSRALEVLDIPNFDALHLQGADMPPFREFVAEMQKNGTVLSAPEIYRETVAWPTKPDVSQVVSPIQAEQYAMHVAR